MSVHSLAKKLNCLVYNKNSSISLRKLPRRIITKSELLIIKENYYVLCISLTPIHVKFPKLIYLRCKVKKKQN